MVPEHWVLNASPLIVLSRAGHENLLLDLPDQVVVPRAVALEIQAGPVEDRAKQALASGGELKAFYLTMGQYDAVAISEAPSDEVYATTILAIAAAGAISSESLRAFPEDEYRKIIAALPAAVG